jgi:hypothetical protein
MLKEILGKKLPKTSSPFFILADKYFGQLILTNERIGFSRTPPSGASPSR